MRPMNEEGEIPGLCGSIADTIFITHFSMWLSLSNKNLILKKKNVQGSPCMLLEGNLNIIQLWQYQRAIMLTHMVSVKWEVWFYSKSNCLV